MKVAYQTAVGVWKMSPESFWGLHPVEYHWLIEANTPVKMYGDMTEDEVAELYQLAYGDPDE